MVNLKCACCPQNFLLRHLLWLQMVSMLRCTHLCCRNCAREYFTVQVRDKTIVDATCPFCAEPSTLTDDAELATEYFNHLDILLKNLVDSKHHEMFQRKLRDWTLAKTPNFKWCSKVCSKCSQPTAYTFDDNATLNLFCMFYLCIYGKMRRSFRLFTLNAAVVVLMGH